VYHLKIEIRGESLGPEKTKLPKTARPVSKTNKARTKKTYRGHQYWGLVERLVREEKGFLSVWGSQTEEGLLPSNFYYQGDLLMELRLEHLIHAKRCTLQ